MAHSATVEGVEPLNAERRRWPAILALPLITLLPVLVFAIATVVYLTQQQQRALERDIVQVARQSIQAADLLLEERLSTLEALSRLAAQADWRGFSTQSRLVLGARPEWHGVAVKDADGALLASETSSGAPGPLPVENLDAAPEAPGSAVVVLRPDAPPVLLLHTATGSEGEPGQLIVTAVLDLAPFSRALAEQASPEWTVALLDASRVIAGRSRAAADFVGVRATPSLVEEIEAANENFFYALNQEGERVYTAFSTSPHSGWTAAVGAPARLIEAPLRRAQSAWILGGLAAVALAAVLAWLLIRTILERHAAERRAWQLESERQSEARLTDIASHFPGVIYRRVLHPNGQVSYPYLSEGAAALIGPDAVRRLGTPSSLEDLARDYIVPEDRRAMQEAVRESVENLAPYTVEARIRRPDGSLGWLRSTASTRKAGDGTIVWDGVILDTTKLKETENALKTQTEVLQTVNRISIRIASELDREKLVKSVLDAGCAVIGAAFGAFFYNVENESGESYMLYTLSGAKPEDFSDFPMPRNTAIFGPTFEGEGMVRFDDVTQQPAYGQNPPYHGMPEGHLPVRSYLAAPVVSRNGEVLGGLFFGHPEPGVFGETAEKTIQGITAQAAVALENARLFRAAEDEIAHRREVEAQQKMLLAELNHRVKNTLAVVLAIAQQTAQRSGTVAQFNADFSGRIMALANAHTLLTAGNWQSTTLRALVATALGPHVDVDSERVSISGVEVTVPPKQAVALSLVFHELATNASKYGALSAVGGRIHIEWVPAEDETLLLTWREKVSGTLAEPQTDGFGSRLISMNISREIGGTVRRTFADDGLCAELRLPWNPQTAEIGAVAPGSADGSESRAAQ